MSARRFAALVCVLAGACGVQELSILEGDAGRTLDAALDAEIPRDAPMIDVGPDAGPPVSYGRRLCAGRRHTCVLRAGGLWCWGDNAGGQLGTGAGPTVQLAAARVPIGDDVREVACGEAHTCALDGDGALWCWGRNDHGQLGQGDDAPRDLPVEVRLPALALHVGSGENHVCVVLVDGRLACWGHNTEGQLGLDDAFGSPDVRVPTLVGAERDWTFVAGHQGSACGLRGQGLLHCWGRNSDDQLGLGPSGPVQRRYPTQVDDGVWSRVEPGQNHGCGLDATGALLCWGENTSFQLGLGDRTARPSPTRVDDGPFADLDTDTFHGCVVSTSGSLRCWGRNVEGQLGAGDLDDRRVPSEVGEGQVWAEVATGRFHTCARAAGGAVFCTGANDGGQLGTGDMERRRELSEVAFLE